jgi:hypothetical protein
MKSTNLFILITFLIPLSLSSQSCLPEGIIFSTQQEIDDFQFNYPGCSYIGGDVLISGDDINNLLGLSSIDSIGGDLGIGWYYWSNPQLASIIGLDNLSFIGGNLYIEENTSLLNLIGLESLQKIGESLYISYNHALESLESLNNLTTVGQDVRIQYNYVLTFLNGLNSLSHLEGTLEIYSNYNLVNLSGLDNITQTGSLSLNHNHNLENIDALSNLSSVNGFLYIAYNHKITDLRGLGNLTSINSALHIKFNNGLISLLGIDQIISSSIDPLYIFNNPLLTTCHVQSICDYLSNPHGNCIISDNSPGCNSISQVEEACLSINIPETNAVPEFSCFPSPTRNLIFISTIDKTQIEEVFVCNQLGKIVLSSSNIDKGIDLSQFVPGLYIIEIITKFKATRIKIIKI